MKMCVDVHEMSVILTVYNFITVLKLFKLHNNDALSLSLSLSLSFCLFVSFHLNTEKQKMLYCQFIDVHSYNI